MSVFHYNVFLCYIPASIYIPNYISIFLSFHREIQQNATLFFGYFVDILCFIVFCIDFAIKYRYTKDRIQEIRLKRISDMPGNESQTAVCLQEGEDDYE